MFCKNCGKELPDSAKFCSGCGTPVAPAVPQPAPASEPEVQEPVVPVETAAPTEIFEIPVKVPDTSAEETPIVSETPEIPVEEVPAAPEVPEPPVAVAAPESPVQAEEPVDPVVESAAPFQPAAPAAESSAPTQAKKRRGTSGLVVIGAGVVAAVVVVVVLFKLISGMAGGSKRTPAYAYLTDDYELMYLSDLKEKTDAIEITDDGDSSANVQFTADGKTLYFRDNSNTLYKITVSDLKKDGRPERISRDVTGFTVLKTGNVLYTKTGSNGNRELNCYTGKDDFRVTKNYSTRQFSEDQKTVYFTEQDEDDGTLTLYKVALKKDAQPEELLEGATSIYTSFDSGVLVYGEDEMAGSDGSSAGWSDDMDRNSLTVYSCKPSGEPTELIDDIYSVSGVKVDGSKVSFYYMVEELDQYKLYDLVSDSQQSADAATTAQDLVRPDWYSGYYIDELYVDGNTAYYRDRQGQSYPVDTSALQASTGLPVSELYYYDVYNIAYADAQARYNAALEDYNAKYDDWNAANSRNSIREQLKNETYTQRSFSLYQYTGSADSSPIGTDISLNQICRLPEEGVFLYKKAAGITGGKVCDVSDLSYYGEIYDYLNSGSSDDDWYQNVGGTESVLELDDEETSINGFYALNGKEVVLDLALDGDRWLDAYSIGKTALTFSATVIDDDFSGWSKGTDAKGNDVLYFFTDVDSDNYGRLGDLTRYSGGKTEVLVKEVYGAAILDDSGTIYAVTDWSRSGAELSLIQGEKQVTVSDELDDRILIFLDSKQVLYTADGDLYLWNGKEERRIAKDVINVWANAKESYSTYSPS